MRVISYGISLKAGHKHVSLEDLFASLKQENGEEVSGTTPRLFYFDDTTDKDFYRGLVVTMRDQKTYIKLVEDGDDFKFDVQNLDASEKLMEFNLFVIRKQNGMGIYQYYHRSCPTNTFLRYLRSKYKELSHDFADEAVADLRNNGGKTKQQKELRKEFKPALDAALIVRPDDLEAVLNEYDEVRGLSFEITSLDVRRAAAGPLEPLVKKLRQSVTFNQGISIPKIAGAIKKLLPSINDNTARVSVLDEDEESFSLRISGIPTNFGESSYDEVAAELQGLDVSKFATSTSILNLQNLWKKHKDFLMQDVE